MNTLNKTLIAATLAASAAAAPVAGHAETVFDHTSHPEQTRGVAWGAALGALAGGPLGAIIGATGGGIFGYQKGIESELEETRSALAEARQAAERAEAKLAEAERIEGEFAAFQAERDVLDAALFELAEGVTVTYGFRTGSARVEPHVERQVTRMGKALAAVPRVVVQVDGFADERGSEAVNRELSGQRARAVARLLEEAGVAPERIQLTSQGETNAFAHGDDPEGWFFDRRVVVTLHPLSK